MADPASALTAIGKALSNKNMAVLKECAAAHREAIKMHTAAADKLDALIAEHSTKDAARVVDDSARITITG